MKSTKLLSLGFALLFTISTGRAQDVINLIPKESAFVTMIDMNQINTKARFSELVKLPLLKKISEETTKNLFVEDTTKKDVSNCLDLTQYGINITGKSYFYFINNNKVNYGALVLPLDDEAKFSNFVKLLKGDNEESQMTTKDNYKYATKSELKIVWNNKVAAFWNASLTFRYRDSIENIIKDKYSKNETENTVTDTVTAVIENAVTSAPATEEVVVETSPSDGSVNDSIVEADSSNVYNNYDEPYYDKSFEAAYSAWDSIKDEWCKSNIGKFLQDKGTNSLANNKEFMDYIKTAPDAAMLFDYGLYNKLMMNSLGRRMPIASQEMATLASIMTFYSDQMMFSKLELNKDDAELKFDMKYGKKSEKIYKEIKKKKISENFLKYMDKDLMGYVAVGIDIPGLSKGVGNYLRNSLFPAIPEYGNIASSAMEVLDLIIDEQTLYKIFTGDVVLAVNGVKPVEVIHTSYNYDDNFNRTEVIDTSVKKQPEVVLMLGIQTRDDVNKIINLLTSTKVLKKEGELYSIVKNDSPIPVFFTIKDNILFMSNIKSYMANPVVYAQDRQFGTEHAKLFAKNTSVAFVNTAKIAGYFAKEGPEKSQKISNEAAGLFSNITMYGGNTGKGYSSSRIKLKLSETSDNSIADVIKFINTIYVISTSEQSEQKVDE